MKPFLALLVLAVSTAGAQPLPYSLHPDRVVEGGWTARVLDRALVSNASGSIKTWKPTLDLSGLPRFQAPESPLLEVIWNLSLEEVLKDKISGGTLDGALSAGALWPGVWTRDASFAAHLSLAWLFPDAVKASLRAKVADGRIVQDTGTGGSWPVSTDRVVWALAARELVRAGDRAWAEEAYPVLVRSAEADRAVAFDPASGLYNGETNFLDWREQSYPAWFQPADIYQSPATGTNALHRALYATLEEWAALLGRPLSEVQKWRERGDSLAAAINSKLWEGRLYSIYRYPLTSGGQLSNRTDALGNALAVLTGTADTDRAASVVESLPVEAYGPPVLYPQLAHTGPYHNKSVWPFVTAYYGWAAQHSHRPGAAAFALEANLRAAALFLTNKENLVHDTGRPEGTSVNSDRQLWSAAGQLSGYLRTLFGLDLQAETLSVSPVVPSWVKGTLSLTGLPWRGRILNVTVSGTGSQVSVATINGQDLGPARMLRASDFAPGSFLSLRITLVGDSLDRPAFAEPAKGPWDATSLTLNAETNTLAWKTRNGVERTRILSDGAMIGETKGNSFVLPLSASALTVYSVETWNTWPATLAEPVLVSPARVAARFADTDLGEAGDTRTFPVELPASGRWLLRFRYTNTAGPVATDNKAAVRTLSVDGRAIGALVFPQRGYVSTNRGWSSYLVTELEAGSHLVTLTFTPESRNMGGVNRAVVDAMEALPVQ